MLVGLDEATHVCAGPQSCEGGQPPQVPLQPSSPQVFPVQLAWQSRGTPVPESPALPDELVAPELVLELPLEEPVAPDELEPDDDDVVCAPDEPVLPPVDVPVPLLPPVFCWPELDELGPDEQPEELAPPKAASVARAKTSGLRIMIPPGVRVAPCLLGSSS